MRSGSLRHDILVPTSGPRMTPISGQPMRFATTKARADAAFRRTRGQKKSAALPVRLAMYALMSTMNIEPRARAGCLPSTMRQMVNTSARPTAATIAQVRSEVESPPSPR